MTSDLGLDTFLLKSLQNKWHCKLTVTKEAKHV